MFLIIISSNSYSAQTLVASKVSKSPVIDGSGDDLVWEKSHAIITHDNVADIDITLRAIYTEKEIFFLIVFPDSDESRTHKSWIWDKNMNIYKTDIDREDTFIIKWNKELKPKDLSIYADEPYVADIWFWKACRTDPVGFADDKIQILSSSELPKSKKMTSNGDKTMYLIRAGDKGTPAYENTLYAEYQGDNLPRFKYQLPKGSRSDIRAKGSWSKGKWSIELGRILDTGHEDDIQFIIGKSYQFGISRYEIAGREPDPKTMQPLYGTGDISERLTLHFDE